MPPELAEYRKKVKEYERKIAAAKNSSSNGSVAAPAPAPAATATPDATPEKAAKSDGPASTETKESEPKEKKPAKVYKNKAEAVAAFKELLEEVGA